MNAAIRTAVRQADAMRIEVYGVWRGLQGLVDQEWRPLTSRGCANILQRGGSPTALDRIWGSRWGSEAVRRLADGDVAFYSGVKAGELVSIPLSRIHDQRPAPSRELAALMGVLAR